MFIATKQAALAKIISKLLQISFLESPPLANVIKRFTAVIYKFL
jgi:hypothetical protein